MSASRDGLLLELVGELQGVLDLDDFRGTLVRALRTTVPADWVSLNAIGPEPGDVWFLSVPEPPAELVVAFQRHAHQNPLVQRFLRTQDGRAYRFSDVVTPAALRRLDLFREVYARLGVEHQIALTLPSRPGHVLGIALSRRAHDFSDAERELLNRARPYLIQCYRTVLAFADLREVAARHAPESVVERLARDGLTAREAQIVRLVALGRSNQAVADELGLSVRTVQKHLEHAFRKLGVGRRSDAAAHVWATVDGSPNGHTSLTGP
jgi:DNA-binding CsgD family transcriptional regulator